MSTGLTRICIRAWVNCVGLDSNVVDILFVLANTTMSKPDRDIFGDVRESCIVPASATSVAARIDVRKFV